MKHKIKKVEDDISTKQQTNFVVYTHEDILSYLRSFDQMNFFLLNSIQQPDKKKIQTWSKIMAITGLARLLLPLLLPCSCPVYVTGQLGAKTGSLVVTT